MRLETKKLQYLYNDGADFNFMDNDTFEQMAISTETVGDAAKWLKENDEASLLYAGDELISIEPQMFVELEVTHTEPGFKGDTATNVTKPATLETGARSRCPCSSTLVTRSRSTPAPESTWERCKLDGRDRWSGPQRAGMGIDKILQRLKRTKSGRERHWGRGYDTELKEA